MANMIPGVGVLGAGFDIFGEYSAQSAKQLLFDLTQVGSQYSSPANGPVYDVPKNVSVNAASGAQGQCYVFSTKQDYQSHFAVKANVKGSYAAFSGEFDASFDTTSSREAESSYGLYENDVQIWTMQLIDQSAGALLSNVKSDPDLTNIPSSYSVENQYLFFRFFQKYGTHFVSSVGCGARMYYTMSVDKSYLSDATTISAKLTAEYKGTFVDVGASASSDWSVADKQWFANRRVTVRTTGGNTDLLAAVVPEFGQSDNSVFTTWLASVPAQPAPVEFRLQPVTVLFSGDQAAAVAQAYEAYANSRIYVEARTDFSTILLSGKAITPPQPIPSGPPWHEVGFQVAVIDRSDLNIVLNKRYNLEMPAVWTRNDFEKLYAAMYADLSTYAGQTDFIFCLASYSFWGALFPTQSMYQFLLGAGAGDGLRSWEKEWAFTGSPNEITYGLIGICGGGPNSGLEVFNHTTNPQHNVFNPPPPTSVTGFLIPTSTGSEDQMEYDLRPA